MTTPSMTHLTANANATASVRRNVPQSGKAPVPTTVIASLAIMPLSVLDAQTRARVVIDTPHQLKQTFAQSDTQLDIHNGYMLVIANKEYPIRDIGESPWLSGYRYQIVVEVIGN